MAVMRSKDCEPNEEPGSFPRPGSIRKVLHSLVGTDSLLGKSAKMLDRPKSKGTSSEPEDYSPFFKEYSIMVEYNLAVSRHIPGVYVIPSANSELLWFGVMFIRSGIYRGGVFRFMLQIPDEFPNCGPPRFVFETRVYHPSVDSETQELSLENVFGDWSKDINHIWQVIDYARTVFYQIPTNSISNKSAAQLYECSKEEFARQVMLHVNQSQCDIYKSFETEDAHYLEFSPYDENIHGETLRALKTPQSSVKTSCSPGLSWVKRGSLKPCSTNSYF